jgi:DNA-binding beta-propeller fold protein YncE
LAILALGFVIGIIASLTPLTSSSQLHSTITTPVSVDPNDYKSQRLTMTRGELVSFSAQLDNKTSIRLYIMNSSQYSIFYGCAPRCLQPLLGGQDSYFQQAGLSKPDLFLNTSISETKPFNGNFTAPTSGTFYFVFDNSVGENWSTYLHQNAAGFAVGSIGMSVSQVATVYSVNWLLVIVGISEIAIGGVVATSSYFGNVKKVRPGREGFLKRFGMILALVVILGALVIDLPVFYSAATNSPNSFLPGFGSKPNSQNQTNPAQLSNDSVFEIDSDYLSNIGPSGYGSMAVDSPDQFLFIATKQNNSLYIYDLPNEAETDVSGFNDPQSVLYVPQTAEIFVTNAGNGTIDVLTINSTDYPITLQRVAELTNFPNAGSLAYDSSNGLVYFGYGSGNQSGIGIINANDSTVVGSISLPSTPGQLSVEQNGTKIFASLGNSVDVIDKTSREVIDSWPYAGALALDEADNQIFIGTQSPPQLLVLNDQSGSVLTTFKLSSAPGDVAYDPASKLVFATCVRGTLEIYQQDLNGTTGYFFLSSQTTGPQASTSVFYPDQELILVAIPQYPYQLAQIMTFGVYTS